jgi:biopolymer transport protein ExbB/TolQ
MFDFIILGGPILWVIMALSVVACAIIIERFLYSPPHLRRRE